MSFQVVLLNSTQDDPMLLFLSIAWSSWGLQEAAFATIASESTGPPLLPSQGTAVLSWHHPKVINHPHLTRFPTLGNREVPRKDASLGMRWREQQSLCKKSLYKTFLCNTLLFFSILEVGMRIKIYPTRIQIFIFESHRCFLETHCIFAKINILKQMHLFKCMYAMQQLEKYQQWLHRVIHFNSAFWQYYQIINFQNGNPHL